MPPIKHLTTYYKRGRSSKGRYKTLVVRLSVAEYADLQEQAKAKDSYLSAFVRKKLGVGT